MNVKDGVTKKERKKRHYTMQMIWLLGAADPAKKVHFNLNGSELRGFPIKARSGQSSILYANPLAPNAVARFCLCPAVITQGPMCPRQLSVKVGRSDATFCPISIPVIHTVGSHSQVDNHCIPSHHLLECLIPFFQSFCDLCKSRINR